MVATSGGSGAVAFDDSGVGGVAEVEAGRITRIGLAMASVAPVTALLPKTRALVAATPLADLAAAAVDAAVAAAVTPIDDIRSTAGYRLHCAKAIVRGFLRDLGAPV